MNKKSSIFDNLFDVIIENKLTPNQFYVLYSMYKTKAPKGENLHLEIRDLIFSEWIVAEGKLSLTSKARTFLENVLVEDSSKSAVTETQIENYNNIFPKIKIPTSQKPARSNSKNLIKPFEWFLDNYNYDWETILKATEMYVEYYDSKAYRFMQTSQYFIRKQDTDKSWTSSLADWCQLCLDGVEPDRGVGEAVV